MFGRGTAITEFHRNGHENAGSVHGSRICAISATSSDEILPLESPENSENSIKFGCARPSNVYVFYIYTS